MKTLRKICEGSESKFKIVGKMFKTTETIVDLDKKYNNILKKIKKYENRKNKNNELSSYEEYELNKALNQKEEFDKYKDLKLKDVSVMELKLMKRSELMDWIFDNFDFDNHMMVDVDKELKDNLILLKLFGSSMNEESYYTDTDLNKVYRNAFSHGTSIGDSLQVLESF